MIRPKYRDRVIHNTGIDEIFTVVADSKPDTLGSYENDEFSAYNVRSPNIMKVVVLNYLLRND